MCSIRNKIWRRRTRTVVIVALSISIITTIVCLGPDLVASAIAEHLLSLGARATGTSRTPTPGLASASYAVAIRVTVMSRRALSRLELVPQETNMFDSVRQESRSWPPTFETLAVRVDGGTLFADIPSPSTNLAPAAIRDLAALNELAEADDDVRVVVIKSADAVYLIRTWDSHGSRARVRRLRSGWPELI
jgi:hypothetical protein